MVVLYVVLAVFALLVALLLLPLKLKIEYNSELNFKLTYCGFNLLKSKTLSQSAANEGGTKTEKEGYFAKLFREKTFPEFVKFIVQLLKNALSTLKYILKYIKIRKFKLSLTVASNDAATTGIYYGVVCATVYAFLEFLESNINLSFKKVDVSADFEATKPSFEFSTLIKIAPIFLIIAAITFSKKYIELTKNEGSVSNE